MASFAGGKIEAYVGPPELGGADDLEQVIVDFLAGAKTRWTSRSKRSTHGRSPRRSWMPAGEASG
jgi:hypothetical protein